MATKTKETKIENEVADESTQKESENKTVSLEATTAKTVVALFIAVERFIRACNPEGAAKLAAQRIELETAINLVEEE